jgi:hypothetical protein
VNPFSERPIAPENAVSVSKVAFHSQNTTQKKSAPRNTRGALVVGELNDYFMD